MQKFLLLILLITFSLQLQSKVYKWVDENGVVHYSANKPEDQQVESMDVKGVDETKIAKPESSIINDMNCDKAISETKVILEKSLKTNESNYNNGYTDKARYMAKSTRVKNKLDKLSIQQCENARGNLKIFFLCMVDDQLTDSACVLEHNYLK